VGAAEEDLENNEKIVTQLRCLVEIRTEDVPNHYISSVPWRHLQDLSSSRWIAFTVIFIVSYVVLVFL
jgi:hypothetical protein